VNSEGEGAASNPVLLFPFSEFRRPWFFRITILEKKLKF
jgi:hypothetical protein